MSELITLVKPDGTKVKVNESSLQYAKSLGWTLETEKQSKSRNKGA